MFFRQKDWVFQYNMFILLGISADVHLGDRCWIGQEAMTWMTWFFAKKIDGTSIKKGFSGYSRKVTIVFHDVNFF